MDNRTFGYARVSSREQHEDRQIEALTNYGVSRDNIIVDKCSGKDTEREGYQYLKKQILRNGDTLVIKELDRLSRSKSDIKQELEFFKCNGRQREGIDAALKKNVRFGRPAIAKPENWDTVIKQIDAKEISVSQALQALNISRSSYYRLRQNNPF